FSWMREVTLPVAKYVGAALLPALIAEHQARYADDRRCFLVLDLTVDALPPGRCRSSGGKDLRASSGTVELSLFSSLLATLPCWRSGPSSGSLASRRVVGA